MLDFIAGLSLYAGVGYNHQLNSSPMEIKEPAAVHFKLRNSSPVYGWTSFYPDVETRVNGMKVSDGKYAMSGFGIQYKNLIAEVGKVTYAKRESLLPTTVENDYVVKIGAGFDITPRVSVLGLYRHFEPKARIGLNNTTLDMNSVEVQVLYSF